MIVLDFNQLARIAKLVALIGFFLPWVTVSCSNTEVLNATGWQLMTGEPEVAGPFAGAAVSESDEDHEPAILVVAAFAVVLIGLGASLMTRAQTAALNLLVCAVLGLGLSYFSVQNMRSEMQQEIADTRQDVGATSEAPFFTPEQREQLGRTVAESLRLEEQEGYWLTLAALLLTALFAAMTLTSRRVAATGPPAGS